MEQPHEEEVEGVRQQSVTIDDFSQAQTYATETFGGVELSESEQARIDKILGRATGAFTVRATAQPGYYGRRPAFPHHGFF